MHPGDDQNHFSALIKIWKGTITMNKQTHMTKTLWLTGIFCMLIFYRTLAQDETYRQKIKQIISSKNAEVGVSILGIEDKDTLTVNGNRDFPLQSVFKFHIALAVLNEADKGKLPLNKKIFIPKSDLLPDTWSPIREKYPAGNVKLSLAEILEYTIAESDNNGCDILLELIGGTGTVNNHIHKIGVNDFSIQANEEEMHQDWNVQFSNRTTPLAATELLNIFYERKILSPGSFEFLWNTMVYSQTGKDRIKGQLPTGTLVAHKTGTSGTNEQGVTAAVNDIGIVTLPDGKHFAIAVFVSNSKEDDKTNEKIISDIAKTAWDYFISKTKTGCKP